MAEDRSVLTRTARQPDRTWAYGADPDQVADTYLPTRPAGPDDRAGAPVVLVHGGFWRPEYDRTHLRPMAQALADRGHHVTLIEYRRHPGDPDATVDDVRAAAAVAHERAGRSAVVIGHSAGGHLALLAAADPATSFLGALALAPVANLTAAEALALDDHAVRAFLGVPAQERPDLDPIACAPVVPVTVVHGEDDSLVPASLGADYCAATGARLVLLPGIAHFEVIDPWSTVWPVILTELDALASPAGGE